MKISIVIPNWNSEDKLKKNLPEVLKVDGVDEVIVVDDASSDNSAAVIESFFPQVKLVKNNKNLGFSPTVNLGVRESKGDLIFLLNNDAVPESDSLEKTLHHFEDPKVFSVGCNTGGSWSWAKFEKGFFWHYQAPASKGDALRAHQTLWVSGGSGVFRKSTWEELGGFDELYAPFYEEDVDLGYRATKRGYINLWEPKSKVEHYHQGVSSGNKQPGVISQHFSKSHISKIAQRNQLILIWKNITSKKLINQHKMVLAKMLLTHPKYWSIFLAAAMHMSEILRKRAMEQKESKFSDEEILGKFTKE